MPAPLERRAAASHAGRMVMLVMLLSSCGSGPAVQPACNGRQVVIGFTDAVDATQPAVTASLSRDAGVSVSYMRHLFDHYTLFCAGSGQEPPVTEGMLQRLQERADVLSVEVDAVRQPRGGN